ncbi:MAG TPA: translocation/assembly module TamB domain-containing protein, partial [Sulfurovum sp.]|nr:translocation/assembly module TamB domain-containing protein [Sulfurovum sp.]
GKIVLDGLQADISGVPEEKIDIKAKINSMDSLVKSVNTIYTLTDVPAVKGSAEIAVEITKLKKIAMTIKSPKILYEPDKKTVHQINDIDFAFEMEGSTVQLKRYSLSYDNQKLFSTKSSIISFEGEIIKISPLWLNDQLEITGEYNTRIKKGNITTRADRLETEHEIIDLTSAIDIQTLLDGNKTSVKGKVTLLDGDIHYDLNQKTYASDSDIIIVQNIKEKKESPFMDNLSAMVQIQTKKPLVYKKGDINIEAKVDLQLYKAEYSELMLLGLVEIAEGGSYTFEGKKFVFDKSYVYFTGNLNKPHIEASLKYKSLNYLITIAVTGTADMPKIKFSSKPNLTKEQILSIILFDSEGGAGVKSGEDMMKMMGGAMAKSALSNLGVELDYIALGAEGSVEVGKKLTDDMTIIYINDTVPKVKLKYQHGKRTESVFGVSEESQSYDIIYKRDF